MQLRTVPALGEHLPRRLLSDLSGDGDQRTPGTHGQYLHRCRSLQVIEIVPCLGDVPSGHDNAMVLEKCDVVGFAHDGGDAVTLTDVEGKAIVILVDGSATVELERRLSGPKQGLAFGHAERRRIGHVGVKGGAGARQLRMQSGVNVERGRFGQHVSRDHVAMKIADDQRRCRDLGERETMGIDQEDIVSAGDHEREMIANTLVQTEPGRHPKTRREVDAGLGKGLDVEIAEIDFWCTTV